mgnify:CR=1 FL=1
MTVKDFERFHKKIRFTESCWEWTGGKRRRGYGQFSIGNRDLCAHRVAWMFANLDTPPSILQVCHKCDNPKCVRPDHLFLGTKSDNMRDAVAKGRLAAQNKMICKHGHPYTSENTALDWRGRRYCISCKLLKNKRDWQKQKEREHK